MLSGKFRYKTLPLVTGRTDFSRMVIYFPVSALVTIFGNILQNPLDPRARSDTRLMNLVVNFLSTLGQEAEAGGVNRMLSVCSEFERIAKKVIDKAEKDNMGRRKRKSHDPSTSASTTTTSAPKPTMAAPSNPLMTEPGATPRPQTASTPKPLNHVTPSTQNGQLSPPLPREGGYSPMQQPISQNSSPAMAPANWPPSAASADFHMTDSQPQPQGQGQADFGQYGPEFAALSGMTSPPQGAGSGAMFGQPGQPMLPGDLFSLSATFDWDWAEMSGGAYPSVENGNFGQGR
jgi:hypothetical protein